MCYFRNKSTSRCPSSRHLWSLCPTHVTLHMFIMQVLASQWHFPAKRNAKLAVLSLFCHKNRGILHCWVALQAPTVYSLYCAWLDIRTFFPKYNFLISYINIKTFFVIEEHFKKPCHPKSSKTYKLVALGIMGFQNYKNSYYCSIYKTIICISYFKDDC